MGVNRRLCSIENCNTTGIARALCDKHYRRLLNHGSPLSLKSTAKGKPLETFLSSYKTDTNECIEWGFNIISSGYGLINYKGLRMLVHRLSLMLTSGISDTSLYALHTCDNKMCYNPRHLYWGDQKQNMADYKVRGKIASHSTVQERL